MIEENPFFFACHRPVVPSLIRMTLRICHSKVLFLMRLSFWRVFTTLTTRGPFFVCIIGMNIWNPDRMSHSAALLMILYFLSLSLPLPSAMLIVTDTAWSPRLER